MLNRTRLLAVATASLLGLLAAPAAHAALSGTLTSVTAPVGGFVVGKEVPITITGSFTGAASDEAYLEIQLNPSTTACNADSTANYLASHANNNSYGYDTADVAAGSTATTPVLVLPRRAGAVNVCAYLVDVDTDDTVAHTSTTSTTRQMVATLNLGVVGAPVLPLSPATVNVVGNAEYPRGLFITSVPSATACASSPGANAEEGDVVFGDEVSGPFSQSFTFTTGVAGTYRLCAYLARGGTDEFASVSSTGTLYEVSTSTTPDTSGGGASRVVGPIVAPVEAKPSTVPIPPTCKLKKATVKRHTTLKISCTASGTFTLRIKQGKKTTTRTFTGKSAVYTAKALKLKRTKASIALFAGDRLLASTSTKVR